MSTLSIATNGAPIDTDLYDLTEPEENGQPLEKPRFVIDNFGRLDWAVGKVLGYRFRAKAVKQWAKTEAAQAEADEARFLTWFQPQMEAVTTAEIGTAKRKSVALPNGVAGFVKKALGLVVTDEAAYQAWATANTPDACFATFTVTANGVDSALETELLALLEKHSASFKRVPSVDKNLVNAHFLASGEIPDGCEVVGGADEFKISPPPAKAASEIEVSA